MVAAASSILVASIVPTPLYPLRSSLRQEVRMRWQKVFRGVLLVQMVTLSCRARISSPSFLFLNSVWSGRSGSETMSTSQVLYGSSVVPSFPPGFSSSVSVIQSQRRAVHCHRMASATAITVARWSFPIPGGPTNQMSPVCCEVIVTIQLKQS